MLETNIVITRGDFTDDHAIICHDLPAAIEEAKKIAARDGLDEIIIGGGGNIDRRSDRFIAARR